MNSKQDPERIIPYRLCRDDVRELEVGDRIVLTVGERDVYAEVTEVEQ